MIAIGRQPNIDGLFDTSIQVDMDENGFVNIDHKMETNIKTYMQLGM